MNKRTSSLRPHEKVAILKRHLLEKRPRLRPLR